MSINKAVRDRVKLMYAGKCAYCGNQTKHLTVDHVVSTKRGGPNQEDNLVPSCRVCNTAKGHLSVGQFRNALIYNWFNTWTTNMVGQIHTKYPRPFSGFYYESKAGIGNHLHHTHMSIRALCRRLAVERRDEFINDRHFLPVPTPTETTPIIETGFIAWFKRIFL